MLDETLNNQAVLVKAPVEQLAIGMFVAKLDRPWKDTPFLLQGFLIKSEAECAELRRLCRFVLLDAQRGQLPKSLPPQTEAAEAPSKPLYLFRERTFDDDQSWQAELPLATRAFSEFLSETKKVLAAAGQGSGLSIKPIRQAVESITRSMIRNPDACVWLARLKDSGAYDYQHAVGCAIWALALGRQLGLGESRLEQIGLGAMMMDLGKTRLPASLRNKPEPLTESEQAKMQTHIGLGTSVVENSGICDPDILAMVQYHHERYDGCGYPYGLCADQIPLAGRIAALVDAYDAMTRERPFARALSPSEAIQRIYAERDCQFQKELVEEFIQAVGLYPAGSLVELTSGEVGVVLSGYRLRRLRPNLLLLLDADKKLLSEFKQLNLNEQMTDHLGEPLFIKQALAPGAYDLDPDSFFL